MLHKKLLYRQPGSYHSQIEVIEQGNLRFLRFGLTGGMQGAMYLHRPAHKVFAYQRCFSAVTKLIERPSRFLSLGVGTGTSLRTVHGVWPTCELHGVELDGKVVEVAVRFFDCPGPSETRFHIQDGIEYLCYAEPEFDYIFVDAYMSNRMHGPILDPNFVHILHKSTSARGVIALNVITQSPFRDRIKTWMDEARGLFAEVSYVPVGPWFTEQNTLVILSKQRGIYSQLKQSFQTERDLTWFERLTWPFRIRMYEQVSNSH